MRTFRLGFGSKSSHSVRMIQFWVSVLALSIAGGSFSDGGWPRYQSMSIADCQRTFVFFNMWVTGNKSKDWIKSFRCYCWLGMSEAFPTPVCGQSWGEMEGVCCMSCFPTHCDYSSKCPKLYKYFENKNIPWSLPSRKKLQPCFPWRQKTHRWEKQQQVSRWKSWQSLN